MSPLAPSSTFVHSAKEGDEKNTVANNIVNMISRFFIEEVYQRNVGKKEQVKFLYKGCLSKYNK